jgi:Ser-tRNA(Ala) deacylase AlaX
MTLPSIDTRVTYPGGAVSGPSRVLHAEIRPDGRRVVLLDTTAFHAVDHSWPDQGADRGVLATAEGSQPIIDAVVGATDGTTLHLGAESPVRKGTEGWAFVVVHVLGDGDTGDAGDAAAPREGDDVIVHVDPAYREAVSAGHTGCHLASLALNRAMAGRWKKEVAADALGAPNFDALAIDTTTIGEFRSVDRYRLGKSLRRKGFDVEGLGAALPDIVERTNAQLAAWTATGAAIRIDADGPGLTDRRRWVCDLPGEEARIPCGGTHLTSLAGVGISVGIDLTDEDGTPVLVMETTVRSAEG